MKPGRDYATMATRMMDGLLALSRTGHGSAVGLRIFFSMVEVLIILAGIYLFRSRKQFFDHRGQENDNYASANLRVAIVTLVWLHALILTGLMIYELK